MKKIIVTITLILTTALILGACSDGKKQNEEKDKAETNQTESQDSTKENDSSDKADNKSGSSLISDSEQSESDKSDSNETASKANNEKSSTSSNGDNGVTKDNKAIYLEKLNKLEEKDKNAEAKTTTSDMEEQEEERYKNWDKTLNEIYGVLKEQLSTEEMEKLREEQRNWTEHRDEAAKEASLEYEGGSTEALEYVATQASLTKERCYKLVANYMK